MDENVMYEFLNRSGVSALSKAILTKVNSRITERIVSVIDENSDNNHVPSAAAVYSAINKMSHVKFKTHIGSIEEITEPNGSYIYLQRDDTSDKTWMMYVYDEELKWINIGDTEVDLSNYWSKSADDVEALKVALGINEEIARLEAKFDAKLDEAVAELKDLPANLLVSETGDCTFKISAKMNVSVADKMLAVTRPGVYTFYAERGCPGNPVSVSNSSFRGIAHITQIEDQSVSSGITGHQLAYGWMMMFDQDANVYVNYIRRSVASGWVMLGDNSEFEAEIARLETEMAKKVDNDQMIKLTNEELAAAVEEAYAATTPVL
jgi:hypothetical protein